jgi:hypothetical protein
MLLIPYRASQWLAPISGLSVSSELAPTEDLLATSLFTGRVHYLALCDKLLLGILLLSPYDFTGILRSTADAISLVRYILMTTV